MAVLSACAGCAGKPWTRMDKAMLGVSIACNAVDYAQTEWGLDHGYTEVNPLLGDSPSESRVITAKVATQALMYRVADSSDNRAVSLGLMLLPCLATVAHNYSIGARP